MFRILCALLIVLVAFPVDAKQLGVGDRIPKFILNNALNEPVDIHERLQKGPLVISFYRGGWCPICNEQLKELQDHLPKMRELGADLIAISPEQADFVQYTVIKNHLNFDVLSDTDNVVAKAFGILWEVPAEGHQGFASWLNETTGKTLKDYNGVEGYVLPIPATYVINSKGFITYSFVDPDYKNRASIEEITASLQALASEQ